MTQEQWEQIYALSFSPVYYYILRLSGNPQEAEEVTAETFLRAMESEKQFRGESGITTWLCAIARNVWLGRLREQGRYDGSGRLPDLPGPDNLEERLLSREQTLGIYKAVHGLKEPYKEVFLLRAVAQLSFQQIGALFGKTGNWACVTYHRARKNIKQELEESL